MYFLIFVSLGFFNLSPVVKLRLDIIVVFAVIIIIEIII